MQVQVAPVAWLRTRPRDVIGAAIFATVFVIVPHVMAQRLPQPDLEISPPDIAVTVICAVALTQVRRHALTAFAVTAVATFVSIAAEWLVNGSQLAMSIALFVFAVRASRRHAVIAAVAATLAYELVSFVAAQAAGQPWRRTDVVYWLWLLAAVAIIIHERRATVAALRDRAHRAEETREATARQRVAEDRLRIARDLHDVMAHHVAVITVQAGVAEHLFRTDPDSAADAVQHVRQSARSVLEELQTLVGVLREDGHDEPTSPTPGLDDLPELVESARHTGMEIAVVTDGDPSPMEPLASLAAFRLVQEGLTNAHKHAPGAPVTVRVACGPSVVEVSVVNARATRAGSAAGSGLGLVGMRERVTASRGELQVGPADDGGYVVHACFPHSTPEEYP